jgi:hypothetical protein
MCSAARDSRGVTTVVADPTVARRACHDPARVLHCTEPLATLPLCKYVKSVVSSCQTIKSSFGGIRSCVLGIASTMMVQTTERHNTRWPGMLAMGFSSLSATSLLPSPRDRVIKRKV